MGSALIDSTVLIGFLDADDALHEASVAAFRQLSASHRLVVSAISYAEVLTAVTLGHHSQDPVIRFFEALIGEVLPVEEAVAQRAAALRGGRRSLRLPDALILATAEENKDVERVVCADAEWPKIDGLRCGIDLVKP